MGDNQNQQPPAADGQEPDPAVQAEEAFWKRFETDVKKHVNTVIEDKIKQYTKQGTSRTGGRTSLPQIIANIMFGPENKA